MTTPAPHPVYKLGGNASAAPDPRNYKLSSSPLGGAATPPPSSYTIPESLLMPIMLQTHGDCGPCALAGAVYASNKRFVSPRFTYYLSRQKSGTLPGDNGTYAITNMQIAATLGQADLSVWPYEGNINEAPTQPALTNALADTITYYQCSTLPEIQTAISANHPVHMYWHVTSDWYWPTQCADGSFEVITPTATSTFIGGHFTVIDAYDMNRKCLDGTVGAVRVRNQWGTGWGDGGKAWVSIAGWVSKNGDLGSRFVVTAKQPTPAPLQDTTAMDPITIQATNPTVKTKNLDPGNVFPAGVNMVVGCELTFPATAAGTFALTATMSTGAQPLTTNRLRFAKLSGGVSTPIGDVTSSSLTPISAPIGNVTLAAGDSIVVSCLSWGTILQSLTLTPAGVVTPVPTAPTIASVAQIVTYTDGSTKTVVLS